ncbi:MAG: 4'-phosphopantetheinyl transferase superfamily protein [Chitinophagales bacterium]|nr:4'-phosphopantetheinyl transferase superfamily protein [Chitinophagales bacterium]
MGEQAEIWLLISSFEEELPKTTFDKWLSELPENLHEKILSYKKWRDYQASLFGNLLLKMAIEKAGLDIELLKHVRYQIKDRPYFDTKLLNINDFIDFNISHSGKYVLCALAKNCAIGVDIEKHREIEFSVFDRYFSTNEWHDMIHADNPLSRFFYYWSLKESVIKADGRGSILLQKSERKDEQLIQCDGKNWWYQELTIETGYSSFICFDKNPSQCIIHRLEAIEFLP